jgi:hypothetical protein
MEYQSPGAALSQGLQSGLTLAAQYQQIKAQRDQEQFKRQLETAELGMKLTENKNIPLEQRVSAFNKGVRPVLTRMGINMPEMTPVTAKSDSFQEAVKNSSGLMDQMRAGKVDPHVGMNSILGNFTGALKDMEAETEAQKTQRELIVSNAKGYVDQADKADTHKTDNTPTPAEAIKRQTELQLQLANLNKSDMNSQITAQAMNKAGFNVDPGKVTPEMVDMVKAGVRKELSFLNQYLPDEYRHKEGITMAEAQALKEKGFSTDRMARDFHVTDAPGGIDPLAMRAKGIKTMPVVPPGAAGAIPPSAPMPPTAVGPALAGRPVAPPPLPPPAPMAAPAPVPLPTAGPMSLQGGATQASPSAYPLPAQQSLQ